MIIMVAWDKHKQCHAFTWPWIRFLSQTDRLVSWLYEQHTLNAFATKLIHKTSEHHSLMSLLMLVSGCWCQNVDIGVSRSGCGSGCFNTYPILFTLFGPVLWGFVECQYLTPLVQKAGNVIAPRKLSMTQACS